MTILAPLEYYDRNVPCLAACPVHTNAGAYVAAIADGDDLAAYLTARLPNPFASVCGRVCAAPCEEACRRGAIDSPIAIRALKRFVTEKYGPESSGGDRAALAAPAVDRSESVGIVGGGPSGLAAAHDLRMQGYQVVVYEATQRLGGMMVLGIPEYRLDRDLVQAEIDGIIGLGIDVEFGVRLGSDVTLDELRARHNAVIVAMGASLGRGLNIPGYESDGVLRAIEFLINVNQGYEADVGERVVVIGGGDVAMDAARTALRADAYHGGEDITEAVDVARSALRAGAREVTVIALESREEMPAADFEIEEAEIEGIRFVHRRGPQRIEASEGSVTGLTTKRVLSVFDDEGRFSPRYDEEDLDTLPADSVIIAIGQSVDVDAVGPDGPELSPARTFAVDDTTMRTSLDGVWATGDAARGPRSLIDAIADGRKAAADVHRSFGGSMPEAGVGRLVPLSDFHRFYDDYDRMDRHAVPSLDTNRRTGLSEVELGFTEEQARAEARRCLRCFANIQLNTSICVLCGLCVDVCPEQVISIVPGDDLTEPAVGTALLLDESTCIRCALCVERCPTKALSMASWVGVGSLPEPQVAELVGT